MAWDRAAYGAVSLKLFLPIPPNLAGGACYGCHQLRSVGWYSTKGECFLPWGLLMEHLRSDWPILANLLQDVLNLVLYMAWSSKSVNKSLWLCVKISVVILPYNSSELPTDQPGSGETLEQLLCISLNSSQTWISLVESPESHTHQLPKQLLPSLP